MVNGTLPPSSRSRTAATLFLVLAGLLIALGLLTLLSIGMLILPVGIAMAVSTLFWDRPAVLVGITVGALALSTGYSLTAPLGCLQTFRPDGGPAVSTTCERIALSDLPRLPEAGDFLLAVGIAAVAALAAGFGSHMAVRAFSDRSAARPD